MIRRRNWRMLPVLTVLVTLAGARTGQAQRGSAAPRPAGAPKAATKAATVRAPQGETVSGISCDAMEGARMHTHQHLVLIDHGKELTIPNNVGQRPERNCLYWIHTHTPDGIIHIEAPQPRTFTLGDFFMIWGRPLSSDNVGGITGKPIVVYITDNNGVVTEATGDWNDIELLSHREVTIQIGMPIDEIPNYTWSAH